jgi:hypothetical protein
MTMDKIYGLVRAYFDGRYQAEQAEQADDIAWLLEANIDVSDRPIGQAESTIVQELYRARGETDVALMAMAGMPDSYYAMLDIVGRCDTCGGTGRRCDDVCHTCLGWGTTGEREIGATP